jgi:hypothetical protein
MIAKGFVVENDEGTPVAGMYFNDAGDGLVQTLSAEGSGLVYLGATENGYGTVTTSAPSGMEVVTLGGDRKWDWFGLDLRAIGKGGGGVGVVRRWEWQGRNYLGGYSILILF